MNKIVLLFIFVCIIINIGYPVESRGNKINFGGISSRRYNLKDGETCYTEEGEKGTCWPLTQCHEVNALIKKRGGIQARGTSDLVTKRVCNYSYEDTRVCCLRQNMAKNPIIPALEECGVNIGSKIIGGEFFARGTHPWLVGVGYLKDGKSIKVECGGTLITRRHVLSAAHCFQKTTARNSRNTLQLTHVILGEHDLSKNAEDEPPIILKIAERRNPGYNISFHYKDIELLVLEKDVEFTTYISPACLPFGQYEKNFNFIKNKMIVAGWGKTAFADLRGSDRPKQAVVPLVPLDQCKKIFERFSSVFIDETQICLGGKDDDTCEGDSGGPVIFRDKGRGRTQRYFVVGITAFGVSECGDKRFPAVYTYVPHYIDWILANL